MIKRIPLAVPWQQMSHHNLQAKFISQLLQPKFPKPGKTTVGVATLDLNQQFPLTGILKPSDLDPPAPDCGDGELYLSNGE
jgi:hypothetical protein